MTYTIIYEKVSDTSFPKGYFYAHIPTLDLTTHGLGIEGAKKAAEELLKIWIDEKRANGGNVPVEEESFYSKIEIKDALYS
ncbi:MAG TPA: type II toxin-antitoxin system HicB family antitoxin [Ignavibacteriaceae bacterium]|nr:type II toxin-antitoxin system HicB family antitoxin [Ignavibacteriaceae bacterium]